VHAASREYRLQSSGISGSSEDPLQHRVVPDADPRRDSGKPELPERRAESDSGVDCDEARRERNAIWSVPARRHFLQCDRCIGDVYTCVAGGLAARASPSTATLQRSDRATVDFQFNSGNRGDSCINDGGVCKSLSKAKFNSLRKPQSFPGLFPQLPGGRLAAGSPDSVYAVQLAVDLKVSVSVCSRALIGNVSAR